MLKKIIVGVVAILILTLLIIAGRPTGNEPVKNTAAAALSIEEKSFDFGRISMTKGKVNHEFTVKNNSAEPVLIKSIITSCMCTNAFLETETSEKGPYGMPGHGSVPVVGETMAPGEARKLRIEFDPAAHGPAGVGSIVRSILIEEEGGGELELIVKASVTP